jgi:hypothetical protein
MDLVDVAFLRCVYSISRTGMGRSTVLYIYEMLWTHNRTTCDSRQTAERVRTSPERFHA